MRDDDLDQGRSAAIERAKRRRASADMTPGEAEELSDHHARGDEEWMRKHGADLARLKDKIKRETR